MSDEKKDGAQGPGGDAKKAHKKHKKHSGGGGHGGGHGEVNLERWLVSYADFMTLLFCLFVVLYAMSIVDQKKMIQVAKGFVAAMGGGLYEARTAGDVDINRGGLFDGATGITGQTGRDILPDLHVKRTSENQLETIKPEDLAEYLEKLIRATLTQEEILKVGIVPIENVGVRLSIPDSIMYRQGSLDISDSVLPMLEKIATLLEQDYFYIDIEAHADWGTNTADKYSSTWEISSAKAQSVLQVFLKNFNLSPKRLVIKSFGDSRPIAPLDSMENMDKNRRTVLLFSTNRRPED